MRGRIAIVLGLLAGGCGGSEINNAAGASAELHPPALVGRWAQEGMEENCDSGSSLIMEFFEDGDFSPGGARDDRANWRVENGRLVVTTTNDGLESTTSTEYLLGDNRLTIGGSGAPFVKCGTRAVREAIQARQMREMSNAMNASNAAAANSADSMMVTNDASSYGTNAANTYRPTSNTGSTTSNTSTPGM